MNRAETAPMRFASRALQLAKDADHPDENQDACQADAQRGIAAIADGVASGIFSRRWARILTQAAVADTPDPGDAEAFARWLAERREAWSQEIDVAELAWFQKAKLREGAFSTLLWLEILPLDEGDRRPDDPWRLHAFAVGDSCLFHVRQGELLQTFPIQEAEQLESDPLVIGSVDLNRDEMLEFTSLEEICRPGDLLVLCTDAVADWALRGQDAGQPPAWEDYWTMGEQAWREEVVALRAERKMRYDDATLLFLRVGDGVTAPPPAEAIPSPAEVAEEAEEKAGEPSAQSPPPPRPVPQPDWTDRLRSLSEQIAGQVTEQVARGIKKLKDVRKSAESAIRKYQQRGRPEDKDRSDDS